MKNFKNVFLLITFMVLSSFVQLQESETTNFFSEIKYYDLNVVLTADSIDVDEERNRIAKQEPYGFIGDNFQRFYIHFTSVIKNPENPYQYLVYGKTKVKKTICDFQGTITIKAAKLWKDSEAHKYKQGYAIGEYKLYENSRLPATGYLHGKVTTNFYLDQQQNIFYDDMMFISDGFANNQYEGSWTSYKTGISKKCNWGDYRIPASGDLDIGAGEISINQKYVKNGWESYMNAWGANPNTPDAKKARLEEETKWWK